MATFNAPKPPKPIEINKWLGLNESVGDTEIKPGESVVQENFRITKNYKPQKRPGHWTFVNCPTSIRGWWYGEISGEKVLIFSTGGKLYRYNLALEGVSIDLADLLTGSWDDTMEWDDLEIWDEDAGATVVLIGDIADSKVEFKWFNDKLYILNSTQYKTYDGTTYADVDPYVPTLFLSSPPTGGGTLFEEVNLLTGLKKQEFVGNGTATKYVLAETNIDSAYTPIITVNGASVTAFTTNFVAGEITFTTAPVLASKVIIQWRKNSTSNPTLIYSHKYMTDYGVENDTNLFLFGSDLEKNTFRYSMVGKPNYFPANAFTNVSSTQFSITDLVSQYQSLIVFKQDGAFIVRPRANPAYETNKGLNPYDFPYYDLNESVGNVAPNMVQLVENNPVSLYGSSMWLWSSATGVEDERNAKIISDRIKLSLQDLDLSTAVTFDYQDQKELWVAVDDKVYIWNYGNDTMYIYTNVSASAFLLVDGNVCYISGTKIERFKESYVSDTELLGDAIPCVLKSGFADFNTLESRKMMRDEWLAISPDVRTSVDLKFVTDRLQEDESKTYTVEYKLLDFNDIDFNDFSFLTNINPQPNRLEAKIKKFTYLQYVFTNFTNDETCTVLKLLMQAQVQGQSR